MADKSDRRGDGSCRDENGDGEVAGGLHNMKGGKQWLPCKLKARAKLQVAFLATSRSSGAELRKQSLEGRQWRQRKR